MSKILKSERIQTLASEFLKDEASREDIGAAGAELFLKRST